MTDLCSAIYDDIEYYEALCKYYNEKPVIDKCGSNPYCAHSHKLERRHTKERERSLKKKKRS